MGRVVLICRLLSSHPAGGAPPVSQRMNDKRRSPKGGITIVPDFSLILHDLAEVRTRGGTGRVN